MRLGFASEETPEQRRQFDAIRLELARALTQTGKAETALGYLQAILQHNDQNTEALKLKQECEQQLRKSENASSDMP